MYSSIRDLQMSLADLISSLSENQRNKRTMCQLTFNQQLLNTKLSLAHLKRLVMLLVMGVVTPIVFIQTIKAQEFGGALFVFASNFRVFTPLSSKLRGLR
jgi:hypothetical protein